MYILTSPLFFNIVFLRFYKSIAEASKETNTERTNIEKCCNRKNKTAGEYIFKFMS